MNGATTIGLGDALEALGSTCASCGGTLGRLAQDGQCARCLDRQAAGITPSEVFTVDTQPVSNSDELPAQQPELRTLQVAALVLDPSLQCRAAIDSEVVASYAESMREGATFPAIRVVHVDKQLLVVDGWHRVQASKQAGRKTIDAQVRLGTRREALLAAIAANSDHGKSRTIEDKRRAVRALLQDPEWCRLASRELARLAGTSHTFINDTRARYGVEPGEVLTELRVTEVEQGIPAAWAIHYLDRDGKPISSWEAKERDAVRLAPNFAKALNAAKGSYGYSWNANLPLLLQRVEELAARQVPAPPWPAEFEGEATAKQLLDEVDALERLALHPSCPGFLRREAILAIRAAKLIPSLSQYEGDTIKLVEAAVKGRPKLEAALAARRAEWAKGREPSPIDKVIALKDPTTQAAALRKLADDQPSAVRTGMIAQLLPEVRDTIGRELLDAQEETRTHACRWPGCDGWISGKESWMRCVKCQRGNDATDRLVESMEQAAYGLQFPEVEIISAAGAYIDGEWRSFAPVRLNGLAIRLLSALAALPPSAFRVDMGPAADAFLQAYCDWHGALDAPPAELRADVAARQAKAKAQTAKRALDEDEDDVSDDQADDEGEE